MVPAYIWLVVSGQDVGRSVELGNGCRRLKQQAKIHSPRIHPEVIQQWHGVVLNFHVLPTDVGLQHHTSLYLPSTMRLTLPIVLLALALTHSQQPLAFAAADEAAAEASVADPDVEEEAAPVEPEDPACPSRPHIIRCAAAHLDVNKNNKLERQELQDAIDSLPWLARGVLKIIGSVDKIMSKCDADGDGAISIDHDMAATEETCLATCFKRKAFKKAFFPDCDLVGGGGSGDGDDSEAGGDSEL